MICLDKSYELEKNLKAYYFIAILMELDRFQEAKNLFEKMIATYPNESFVNMYKADLLTSYGKYDEALELFDKAIEL